MKRTKNSYETVCSFRNLMEAHKKSKSGKGNRNEIVMFELELNSNIMALKYELEQRTYKISGYNCFKVFEPKERDIMSLSYRDRIVQRSLCDNILEPYFDIRLDYDNAACRKGKGTHFALNRLKKFMRCSFNKCGMQYYILKCDIRKYFYSIDHSILKSVIYPCIKDEDIKWLLDVIIDSAEGNVVLPIGNMTSQWFG